LEIDAENGKGERCEKRTGLLYSRTKERFWEESGNKIEEELKTCKLDYVPSGRTRLARVSLLRDRKYFGEKPSDPQGGIERKIYGQSRLEPRSLRDNKLSASYFWD